MDDRGYWHKTPRDDFAKELSEELQRSHESGHGNARPRFVIEIGIGEMVTVLKADDSFIRCTFASADKNKVTLKPVEQNGHQPYLELAERVKLQRENGEGITAQVWDNRGGAIVLRTLPI